MASPSKKGKVTSEYEMGESLGFLVNRAGRAMGKTLREKFDAAGFNVPIEHWIIVAHLWERDGRQQQELADCIYKDKGTVARAINSLQKLGLVDRRDNKEDRRYNLIFLTTKGKKLQQKLTPILLEGIAEASSGIDVEDLATCKKVLRQIYHNLTPQTLGN
jgi:DNA-binding MarR family transcriptional regulator